MKGFVNYTLYVGVWPSGMAVAPAVKRLRFEDVHFVCHPQQVRHLDSTDAGVFHRAGVFRGRRPSRNAALDDFRFVNCTFENDGGHVYIDGGDLPLTDFVFENCTFYKPSKPGLIMGQQVAPVLFKNVKINAAAIRDAEQLKRAGFDLSVPVKVEP